MTTNATEYLAEQRRLAEGATEGPWAAWCDQDGQPHMNHMLMVGNAAAVIPEGETWVEGVDVNPIAHTYTPEDRAFIAAARSSVPRMIAALEAVMEIHSRGETSYHPAQGMVTTEEDRIEDGCQWCQDPWPCPTISAIEAALGASVA